MGKLIFISGGARSGKSKFAEDLLSGRNKVLYIATAIPFDDEMKERILKHKNRRNPKWIIIEGYRSLDKLLKNKLKHIEFILLDCVTVMVSNLMILDNDIDWDNAGAGIAENAENEINIEFDNLLKALSLFEGDTILVTNELGMGIVPAAPLGRHFRDIAGRINQRLAEAAHEAYFLVSGIPVKIKG